ncbi:MAG: hypothetical protein KDA27_21915, partial [Candidatus Eisenbacteria bacterium]|nr:hypothetical protein [Candidatus Eisenbacteria bacterium]
MPRILMEITQALRGLRSKLVPDKPAGNASELCSSAESATRSAVPSARANSVAVVPRVGADRSATPNRGRASDPSVAPDPSARFA